MTAYHSIRRQTVSAYELGCLGMVHGTRARVRRAVGMPDPEPISLTREMLKRPTNGSLEVQPAWPRDLAILSLATIAAAAMIGVVAMAKPAPPNLPATVVTLTPATVVEPTPSLVTPPPAREQPAVVVAAPEPERAVKQIRKGKKVRKGKKNRRAKKRRPRKRRRR